jgi:hypothetical protein
MDQYDMYEKFCLELQLGHSLTDKEWLQMPLYVQTNDPSLIERCSNTANERNDEIIESDLYKCGKCGSRRIIVS